MSLDLGLGTCVGERCIALSGVIAVTFVPSQCEIDLSHKSGLSSHQSLACSLIASSSQTSTPPWWLQVPWKWALLLTDPSLHSAVCADAGVPTPKAAPKAAPMTRTTMAVRVENRLCILGFPSLHGDAFAGAGQFNVGTQDGLCAAARACRWD